MGDEKQDIWQSNSMSNSSSMTHSAFSAVAWLCSLLAANTFWFYLRDPLKEWIGNLFFYVYSRCQMYIRGPNFMLEQWGKHCKQTWEVNSHPDYHQKLFLTHSNNSTPTEAAFKWCSVRFYSLQWAKWVCTAFINSSFEDILISSVCQLGYPCCSKEIKKTKEAKNILLAN